MGQAFAATWNALEARRATSAFGGSRGNHGQSLLIGNDDLRAVYCDDIGIAQSTELSADILARKTEIAAELGLRHRQIQANPLLARAPMLLGEPQQASCRAATHFQRVVLDDCRRRPQLLAK